MHLGSQNSGKSCWNSLDNSINVINSKDILEHLTTTSENNLNLKKKWNNCQKQRGYLNQRKQPKNISRFLTTCAIQPTKVYWKQNTWTNKLRSKTIWMTRRTSNNVKTILATWRNQKQQKQLTEREKLETNWTELKHFKTNWNKREKSETIHNKLNFLKQSEQTVKRQENWKQPQTIYNNIKQTKQF